MSSPRDCPCPRTPRPTERYCPACGAYLGLKKADGGPSAVRIRWPWRRERREGESAVALDG